MLRRSARVSSVVSNHSGGLGAAQAKVFTFPLLYRFVIPSGISRTVFRGSLNTPQISVGLTAGSPNSQWRNVNFGRPINRRRSPTGFSMAQNFNGCLSWHDQIMRKQACTVSRPAERLRGVGLPFLARLNSVHGGAAKIP